MPITLPQCVSPGEGVRTFGGARMGGGGGGGEQKRTRKATARPSVSSVVSLRTATAQRDPTAAERTSLNSSCRAIANVPGTPSRPRIPLRELASSAGSTWARGHPRALHAAERISRSGSPARSHRAENASEPAGATPPPPEPPPPPPPEPAPPSPPTPSPVRTPVHPARHMRGRASARTLRETSRDAAMTAPRASRPSHRSSGRGDLGATCASPSPSGARAHPDAAECRRRSPATASARTAG